MARVTPISRNSRPRRSRARSGLTRIACATVAVVLVAACDVQEAGPKDGEPRSCVPQWWSPGGPCRPSEGGHPSDTGPLTAVPVYTKGPADGSGWSTQPMDQPRPMPGPDFNWFQFESGNCGWTTPELLAALGKTGGDLGTGPVMCAFYIDKDFSDAKPEEEHEQMQIHFDGPYDDHTDTVDVAFMRSIKIAGLEAREYDLKANQDKYPGSCTVEVNTRSIGGVTVMGGTASNSAPDADPRRMCERVRDAAAVLVKTFVPLAGGTPWAGTKQEPRPGDIEAQKADACIVTDGLVTADHALGTDGRKGSDGSATTCTYTANNGVKVQVWLSTQVSGDWQSRVPRIDERELTATTKLGPMPAYQQVTPSGDRCAEAVRFAEGEVLHVAYENPAHTPAELCRIAELVVGKSVQKMIDVPTN